jgi:nucleotide-binding universal stress UspA family protein
MLKRILVGLNGSQYSRAAAEAAIALAEEHHASIVGLGVVDVPHLTAPEAVPLGAGAFKVERDVALVDAADRKISSLLKDFEQQCTAANVSCRALKLSGDPEKLLVREAQGVDLLVMGQKSIAEGPGRVASHVLRETLRHATRPVLSVCQSNARNWNHASVLVAYDGSPQAAKALQIFHAVGLGRGRDIHLLMVTGNSEDKRTVELAADYLRAYNYQAHIHLKPSGLPAGEVILAEAKRLQAGLIVMGAYGESPIKELFFGSVTRAVLKDSKRPLFLYH